MKTPSRARRGLLVRPVSLIGIFLAACTSGNPEEMGPESQVRFDTVGGKIHVMNGPEGLWQEGEAWTIDEDFRIGAASGSPEQLFGGQQVSVSVGPRGRLFVLDGQADHIYVYTADGRFVSRIGRKGLGPGELMAAAAMAWDRRNRLWVPNAFNGRYTVFDSSGSFQKTVGRDFRGVVRLQYRMLFVDSSTFIDQGAEMGVQGNLFVRVDTSGEVIDRYPPLPFPFITDQDFPRGSMVQSSSFFPRLKWTLAPDGTIWFADSGELRLLQRTLEGDTIRIVETTHRDYTAIPTESRAIIDKELAAIGLGWNDVRFVFPIVQAIHVLDDGHIMVQVAEDPHAPGDILDVFDPFGRFLGTIRSPFAIGWLGMPALEGDTIISVTAAGELEVPYVVRATIRRGGS